MASSKELVKADSALKEAELTSPGAVFQPDVDIYETENELVLLADMPGVPAGKLRINLDNDLLTLEGDLELEENGGAEMLLHEFRTGRYRRQFTLGEAIDRANIVAKLNNGELKLVLPKAAEAKPQHIPVSAS